MMKVFFCLLISSIAMAESGDSSVQRKLDELSKQVAALSESRNADIKSTDSKLSIGGYGELLYQNFKSRSDNGQPAPVSKTDNVDFYRNVIYVGYQFNDQWRMATEIEFEHANTEVGGVVEVELATIDYMAKPWLNFRAGLILVPMGFLNQHHEPNTFLSARRNEVETKIIPTTWSENGMGLFGEYEDFKYEGYLVTGMNANGFSSSGIRSGRQKGAFSKVQQGWAGVFRLDYTGVSGLMAGVSTYWGSAGNYSVTNGTTTALGTSGPVPVRIYDLHADWHFYGLELRGLAAISNIRKAAELNAAKGLSGTSAVGSIQWGTYLEAGYDVVPHLWGGDTQLLPFVRAEAYSTQSDVPELSGGISSGANHGSVMTYGLAFKPIQQIAFKIDYQNYATSDNTAVNQYNVAMGYQF